MLYIMLVLLVVVQFAVISKLAIDGTYGIFVRRMLDWLYPVFNKFGYSYITFDIDGLGKLNDKLGYAGADNAIKNSMRKAWNIRRGFGDFIFRYYSGDEFVVAVRGNYAVAEDVAYRLIDVLAHSELGATYVVSNNPYKGSLHLNTMKPKDSIGQRGQVAVVTF